MPNREEAAKEYLRRLRDRRFGPENDVLFVDSHERQDSKAHAPDCDCEVCRGIKGEQE